MSLPSLYQITDDMIKLMESEEVSDEQIEQTFGALTEKANHVCHFMADLSGEIAKFKAEEERISARRKAMEAKHQRLKDYVKQSMDRLGIDKLEAGTFTVSLQKSPPAVVVEDKLKIPARFWKIIPESSELDKAKLKEALQKGEVPGAKLEAGQYIRIR